MAPDVHFSGSTPQFGHPISYRPEIDGLRAVAVIAVVLFHAPLKCPGGYVGVDVFFVLSGYLITSLILRNLEIGHFSLAGFWERRVRRIFPALSIMVLGSLLVGGLLLLPSDFEHLGKSIIAQALFAANVFFWRDDSARGGYFGPTSDDRPLLHTWSLAVEEQFYLLFPLLLIWLYRVRRLQRPGSMSWVMFLGMMVGLAVAALSVKHVPGAAFYLLPARAWELLCGAWVAAVPAAYVSRRRLVREVSSWLGLIAILLPCLFYSKDTPFPGLAALPPCLGAALIIWSNGCSKDNDLGLTSAGRLLALRPVVFVGLISYSFYLWHWPVLVFGKYWWLRPTSPWYFRLGLLLVAFVLSVISWRFVEIPFRLEKTAGTRNGIFRFAAGMTLLSLALGAGLVVSRGLPARLPESVAKNAATALDGFTAKDYDLTSDDIRADLLIRFGDQSRDNFPTLLLWGDSHAQHAIAALEVYCLERGIAGVAATRGAKPPVTDAVFHTGYEADPEFAAEVMKYVKRTRITQVILAARWCWYQGLDPKLLADSLPRTINALHSAGCTVWVLQDVPDVDTDAPKALIRSAIFRFHDDSWYRTESDHRRLNSVIYKMASQNLPATFLDPAPQLLDSRTRRYRPDIDGVSIYFDVNHLTCRASRQLLLPLFRRASQPHN